jgi:hypothetical protein
MTATRQCQETGATPVLRGNGKRRCRISHHSVGNGVERSFCRRLLVEEKIIAEGTQYLSSLGCRLRKWLNLPVTLKSGQ